MINTVWLFADYELGFEKAIKSQRSGFYLETPKEDFPRLLKYMLGTAFAPKFSLSVLANMPKELTKMGITELESVEDCRKSWDKFFELTDKAISTASLVPGVAAGIDCLVRGVKSLSTHTDKSSELPQSSAQRDGFLKGLGKSMRVSFAEQDTADARVLISDAFGDEGLPTGMTMSREAQIALGIVCSSDKAMITAVGDAKFAPLQNMFMIRFKDGYRREYNLLRFMLDKRLDHMGLMLELPHEPTEKELKLWIGQGTGVKPFLATLYFGINYLATGEYEAELLQAYKKAGQTLNLKPNSLFNKPTGNGIKTIKLPVEGGEHFATPLINTGLLRDIHEQYFNAMFKDQAYLWRRMYTQVSVGGSKPQNAGVFFTAVVSNGKIRSLHSRIDHQFSPGSQLRVRISRGRTLFYLTREHAKRICYRPRFTDPAQAIGKLSPWTRKALEGRLDQFMVDVLTYLAKVADTVDHAIEKGELTRQQFLAEAKSRSAIAEREIVSGVATARSIADYAYFLRMELFNYCNLTRAEKAHIYEYLPITLTRKLGEI
ncbi:hypothetical protein ACYPKM_05395 [Pseudomonas aeruginosa]